MEKQSSKKINTAGSSNQKISKIYNRRQSHNASQLS